VVPGTAGAAMQFLSEPVSLSAEDFCRHTLILGSSGSGKTTRAFNPILLDALTKFDAGGLVLAAKPEGVREAVEICRRANREFVLVQPGTDAGIDLFTGSPDVDSMYLRDLFGRCGPEMKPWIDAAVARMKNAFIMLNTAGPQYYTFDNLARYLFDEAYANDLRIYSLTKLRQVREDSAEAWTIRESVDYEDKRYRNFPEQTKASITFACAQLLDPLREFYIVKTFAKPRHFISINEVFNGLVIILHVPRIRYERAAQAIYTLAKRRFFSAVENRRGDPMLDQDRLVIFGADEYQLCISETDVASLGIVRSSRCAVLAATQGISSLLSVLDKELVATAVQNFSQKLLFKTDDIPTLHAFNEVLGFRDGARSISAKSVFDMNRNQALAHVTSGDKTIDEVLTMQPLFID
jgi:hypothetical protein